MTEAKTEIRLLTAIVERRSAVAFDRRPIEPEKLAALVEAARWAPSSTNRQPWRVTFVRRGETRDALDAALSEGNRKWAPAAPLLVVYALAPHDAERPRQAYGNRLDCGLSAQNLMLEATHQGLRTHPLGGWNEDAVRAAVGIPEDHPVAVIVVVGHPGDPDDLPEDVRPKESRERVRVPASENFFDGRFGEPWEG